MQEENLVGLKLTSTESCSGESRAFLTFLFAHFTSLVLIASAW